MRRLALVISGIISVLAIGLALTFAYKTSGEIPPSGGIIVIQPAKDNQDGGAGADKRGASQHAQPNRASKDESQAPQYTPAHECEDDQCFAEKDLIAQQSMARSTRDLVYLTKWQFYVGIFGTLLLVITLVLTAFGTITATRATEVAEKHLLAAERPWVSVSWEPESDFALRASGVEMDITIILKNIGKAPAKNISLSASLFASAARAKSALDSMPDDPTRDGADIGAQSFGYTLFPDETQGHLSEVSLPREEIEAEIGAASEVKNFEPAFGGRVYYKSSISDKVHHTDFIADIGSLNRKRAFQRGINATKAQIDKAHLFLPRSPLSGRVD